MEQEIPDIMLFFGRFHPMILHLPIGFLFVAFALEILSRFDKFKEYKPAVGFTLLLGAASAVVAAILGYMLAQAGGYNENLLLVHQWSGITVALSSVVTYLLYYFAKRKASIVLERAYMATFSVMAIALIVAGHYGGSLTHGSEYLTQYMPNGLRTIAGLPPKEPKGLKRITNLNEAVVFDNIIYPILDARCNSCHNENKKKGDLQMHTVEALIKGGENGPVFVPGNIQDSEMLKRIHLPVNDEDHMPPEGKSQLTDEQVELLAWWIAEGAPFDKKVAEVQVDDKVQAILNTLIDPDANKTEVEKLLSSMIIPADEQVLAQLQQTGLEIKPLSVETHWLQARIFQNASADSLLYNLKEVAEQLTWLNMGGTTISDEALASIDTFKYLTRLHLQKTRITDEGLKHLSSLAYLEYLNLYGTQVSDEGIQQLTGLKNLRKLYLWQTQVTKQGALQLQVSLPGLEVNIGPETTLENAVKTVEAVVKTNDDTISEKTIAKK